MRIPEDRILENVLEKAGYEHGIQIKKLMRGDILKILIGIRILTIKITNPKEKEALVINHEGGLLAPNSKLYIQGSSLTGTGAMLKDGWIAVNYLICISLDKKELYGYVKKVWLNKQLVLPYNENN